MTADEQLLIECEMVIPKVSGDCCHRIQAQMSWYKDACKKNEDKLIAEYEGFLRRSLLVAKQEIAKQQGLDLI